MLGLELTQDDLEDFIIAYYTYWYKATKDSSWRENEVQHMENNLKQLRAMRGIGGQITVLPKKGEVTNNETTTHQSV